MKRMISLLFTVLVACLNSCDADVDRTEYAVQDKMRESTLGDELKRFHEKSNEDCSHLSFRNG